MDSPCSDAHLIRIASSINDWRAIAPSLGLLPPDETAILGEAPFSVPTQRMAMMRRWRQKLGRRATYAVLCQAFENCERTDLVDLVEQLVTGSSSSAGSERREQFRQAAPPRVPRMQKVGGRPTVRELMMKLKKVMDWKKLGLRLQLEPHTLREVEINNRDVESMKMDMYNKWLNATPDAAWSDIVAALYDMNEDHTASQIEQQYCGGGGSMSQEPVAVSEDTDDSVLRSRRPGPGVQYTDAPPAQKMERQSSSSSVQASSQVGYFAVVLGLVVLLVVVLVLYAFK